MVKFKLEIWDSASATSDDVADILVETGEKIRKTRKMNLGSVRNSDDDIVGYYEVRE